jgi:hypothetical protein
VSDTTRTDMRVAAATAAHERAVYRSRRKAQGRPCPDDGRAPRTVARDVAGTRLYLGDTVVPDGDPE